MTAPYLKVWLDVEDLPRGREHRYVREVRSTIEREFPAMDVKIRAAISSGDYIQTDAPDEDAIHATVEECIRDVRDYFFTEDDD